MLAHSKRGTAQGKRVQSNMGAKNHAVVLPDADVDSTVKALAGADFWCCFSSLLIDSARIVLLLSAAEHTD